ncbi:cytochrome c oxidase assembly protein [Paenibacillus alginolyticus]|uniref:Cytochrome c oxidase assembly protein n=1 Tax=Paenibacillus alginolyticus TaxID=59839 RepID=A0ABT4GIX5_9BACL|nr:cytochrome c oxidase assembly protein [Paenibacillus alginolyticus]MCY9696154.1 cytochrome c oxidase assembly protein [Paenibacillus alginolyticus]MEC0143307.1 cytochrome c oxidase assembly protein [Paenibacillus alginolyticus]
MVRSFLIEEVWQLVMSSTISIFDGWELDTWIIVICVIVSYLLVTGRYYAHFKEGIRVSFKQQFYFIAGVMTFGFALGSPISMLAHHMFSAHMLQQSLLYFVVPPLIWLGIPTWLFRAMFSEKIRKSVLPLFTNALVSVIVFNSFLSFYHFPIIYDFIMSGELPVVMYVTHVLLFLSAMLMWFAVTCPEPDLDRLNHLKKIGYIVLNGLLLYPACALIIFADELIYRTTKESHQIFEFLTPVADQQFGGIIMKIVQEGAFAVAIGAIIFSWYRIERSEETEIENDIEPQRS